MKKFILALAAVLCLGLTACGQTQGNASASGSAAEPIGKYTAVIDIADYGTVTLELDGDSAPLTVANFVKLAKDGFYDGLTFHRIMDGFMMQGGDPKGNGTVDLREHQSEGIYHIHAFSVRGTKQVKVAAASANVPFAVKGFLS